MGMGLFCNTSKCCGIYSNKVGSWIIGICDIIFTCVIIWFWKIICLLYLEFGVEEIRANILFAEDIFFYSMIILYPTVAIGSVLMVFLGLKKKKHHYIKIWLIQEVIITIVNVGFLLVITTAAICYASETQIFRIAMLIVALLWIPLKWYLLSIVNSYYVTLKEKGEGNGEYTPGQEDACVVNP